MLSAVGWEIWPWVSGVALAPPPRTPAPVAAAPTAPGRVRVRIFSPDESRQVLHEEDREIAGWLTLRDGVHNLLAQLGSHGAARPPLPPGTVLRNAYLDDAGILYLDFDQSIQRLAGGDWMNAELATSAVGLTLAANLGEVKRIQFLAEGSEITLLSGGIDFRRPFTPRFPGEEAAADTAAR